MALTGLAAAAASLLLLTITSGLLPDATPVPAADPTCAWRLASTQLYADLIGLTDNRSVQLRVLLAATVVGSSGFLPSTCTGGPGGSGNTGSGGPGATGGGSTGGTGGTGGSTGGSTGGVAPAGSYVFDDEFNGTSPDASTWTVLNRPGDASNNESQCYKPDNVTEAGGYLQITSKVDTCATGQKYSSGAVAWKSFNLKFGTIEIRAKQSGGQGSWPAQWLLGADCQHPFGGTAENTGGCNWPNPGSDEVDITEFKSDGPGVDWQNVVSGTSGFKTCKPTLTDAAQNWHTYTLTWAPGSLTWGIDGKTTCTQQQVVPQNPMFLIINNAMGGSGGQINNADFPQTMQIDYVRATGSPSGSTGSSADSAGAVSNSASTGTATGNKTSGQGGNAGPTSATSEGGN